MSNKEYRPTLAQLRTFVTIAENKHFGSAAAKLSISQPSLSQALVALENGLGVQLIERSTRRVIVTPAGEALLPFAKATLDAADAFTSYAQGASGTLSGPLSLGIIPTIAPYILPQLLDLVHEEFPDLELRIIEEQTKHLLQQLRDGQLDCAVLALPTEQPGIIEMPLYTENFRMVVHKDHPFAGRDNLTLSSLRELDLILLDDGHCLHDQIVDLCKQVDINPARSKNAEMRAASLTTVMQLVGAGLGSTLVPESSIPIECTRPNIATASFAREVTAARQVGLVFRASSTRTEEYQKLGSIVGQAYHNALASKA
ncbi:LysR family transcriptional regulator [Corynebacterium ulcerans]|uniref:hydrogen peroxide-inducible genes activator n=1 Tax=Corynebacterium ulcerans TaxID=65058 RepID=UPI0006286803|nr:hydrogen peroxide-inducible genes activator [Corynebacterium ulcerans]KKO85746.1 LysR family transcriptional regulator [Corynebacterium ulcerans]KKO87356.1 LysR family transcriptional regulator [Corynebacterium ulcerans]KPJ23931.1 LysR family transcriptional regulator [Corynebacterium ulcerans]BDV26135.1 transcriptional regulator [Corynebacterium ulcerans]